MKHSRTTRGTKAKDGFSLAELMIAIGILGIGMTMAATLFPTALKQNELSVNDSIGTIIADNGLAVAKAILRHPLTGVTTTTLTDYTGPGTGTIIAANPNAVFYPAGTPGPRGFLVLAIQNTLNTNDYTLVIVPYDNNQAERAEAVQLSVMSMTDSNQFNLSTLPIGASAGNVKGSPFITPTGDCRMIVDVVPNTPNPGYSARLDRPVTFFLGQPWAIFGRTGTSYVGRSPGLQPLVVKTDLTPTP